MTDPIPNQVHTIPFTKSVYIDRSDFRETDAKDYFRLAPGKSVGLLKVQYPITATSFENDPATGLVTVIHARYEKPEGDVPFKKPKSYVFMNQYLDIVRSDICQADSLLKVHSVGCQFPSSPKPCKS